MPPFFFHGLRAAAGFQPLMHMNYTFTLRHLSWFKGRPRTWGRQLPAMWLV
jgi:hypothetical protein